MKACQHDPLRTSHSASAKESSVFGLVVLTFSPRKKSFQFHYQARPQLDGRKQFHYLYKFVMKILLKM